MVSLPHAIAEQTDSCTTVEEIPTVQETIVHDMESPPSSPNSWTSQAKQEHVPIYIYRRYKDTKKSEHRRQIGSVDLEAQSFLTYFEKERYPKYGSFVVLDETTPEQREEVDRQLQYLEAEAGTVLVNDYIGVAPDIAHWKARHHEEDWIGWKVLRYNNIMYRLSLCCGATKDDAKTRAEWVMGFQAAHWPVLMLVHMPGSIVHRDDNGKSRSR